MSNEPTKILLQCVETDSGVFIRGKDRWDGVGGYIFDGKEPSETIIKHWYLVDNMPTRVTHNQSQSNINHRYELIDKTMVSDKIPEFLSRDDVEWSDDDYVCWGSEKYKHLKSLYKEISDKQPHKVIEHPFEIIAHVKMPDFKPSKRINYTADNRNWQSDSLDRITDLKVTHQLADQLIFPDIVLAERPSRLTSHQSYGLIRNFVKENIDGRYAEITSDYRFCFAVAKKIELAKADEYIVDVKTPRQRKPRLQTRYRRNRKIQIFEMTHSAENYKGYTPIAGFVGKNHKDLQHNIDKFCEDLIARINEPLKDCIGCDGTGVIMHKDSK